VRSLAIIALCATVAAAQPAPAADKVHADAIYAEGEELYAHGNYLAAADKFEQAYKLDPDPAVLFNLAQAFRLGHACAQAARYYHEFAGKVSHPPDREQLAKYIHDMDSCAAREASLVKPTIIHDTHVVHLRDVDRGRPKRVLGLVTVAVGVVGLAVGGYLTYDVHQIQQDRASVCGTDCVWGDEIAAIDRLDHRGRRAEILEAVVYSASGVAVLTGVGLYLLGRKRTESVVVATPTPGGAQVSARWRF
jgi:tetratricopeptide (TPR) repeat protein